MRRIKEPTPTAFYASAIQLSILAYIVGAVDAASAHQLVDAHASLRLLSGDDSSMIPFLLGLA